MYPGGGYPGGYPQQGGGFQQGNFQQGGYPPQGQGQGGYGAQCAPGYPQQGFGGGFQQGGPGYGGMQSGMGYNSTLNMEQVLTNNQTLRSANGLFWARMQNDNNFVIYKSPVGDFNASNAIWSSNTCGRGNGVGRLVLQVRADFSAILQHFLMLFIVLQN